MSENTNIWKLVLKEKIIIPKEKINELKKNIFHKLKNKWEEYLIENRNIIPTLLLILNKTSSNITYTKEDLFNINNMYKLFSDITRVKKELQKDLEKMNKSSNKEVIIKLWRSISIIDGFIEFYSHYLEDIISIQNLTIEENNYIKIDVSKILFLNKKNKKLAINLIKEIVEGYSLKDLKISKTNYKNTLIYKILNPEWKYIVLGNINVINLFK